MDLEDRSQFDRTQLENSVPITVANGDGIGPEIMKATLRIIKAAGARLKIEEIQVGEEVYKRGISSGIEPSAWESLRRTRVFLKAPITTPEGGGYKSLPYLRAYSKPYLINLSVPGLVISFRH